MLFPIVVGVGQQTAQNLAGTPLKSVHFSDRPVGLGLRAYDSTNVQTLLKFPLQAAFY